MFKDQFKYYKARKPPPDLSNVLDFDKAEIFADKLNKVHLTCSQLAGTNYGLEPVQNWEAYELIAHPGLIFIRNPFTSCAQRYWTVRCLHDYSKTPNKSNLDALNLMPDGQNWWNYCHNSGNKILMEKMRWVTLGYHHNWDTKVYSEDCKGQFPADLAALCQFIAQVLGFHNYKAEAAIINFYHMDSTLSGHTDHSEHNLEAPLISFSLGQSAIFLLGGPTKEDRPTAMFLRSGDIMVMSKKSRLCYHGVPKILPNLSEDWNSFQSGDCFMGASHVPACTSQVLWSPFAEYLNYSRINVNVRQVLRGDQLTLYSDKEEKS